MFDETINIAVIFIKCVIIGLAVSAPMGPIGVMCIQKTVNKGRFVGFVSGIGAAFADSLYAAIATFGLGFITHFLDENQTAMQIIGVVVLLFLGFKIFLTNPAKQIRQQARKKRSGIVEDFLSVFALTLSNPLTIIFFGASIAAMGVLEHENTFLTQLIAVAGVFSGAVAWWFLVTTVVSLFRNKFRLKQLWWTNKISGIIIIVLTITAAIGLITGFI